MSKLSYRYLRGYTLDPGFSAKLDTITVNETLYRIRWEELGREEDGTQAGTSIRGEYFEIIDVDPSSNAWYRAVDLNSVEVLAQNGLTPSEGDPRFHQQFVYTIAMKTLDHFEKALGRKIIWSPRRLPSNKTEYVQRLRLYPHALREANAYYDTEKKAILFGYFKAAPQVIGNNFPGGTVFTCLSPDIIVHELTHALLDSIHPRFLENTNRDVAAFHEAFADIIALLQRFTVNQLVESQLASTRGSLDEYNLLGELATQFGTAIPHGGGALRSAIGEIKNGKWVRRTPDPSLYQTVFEPHRRGSILVAAFFDALIKIYNYKTKDLVRIATNGTGVLPKGFLSKDLVKRLAQELCQIAGNLLSVAIRALDYCPPVDITFGDYLRALITADIDSAPADDNNYRIALMESFRSWGIFPDRVNTFSEESLKWNGPQNFSEKERKALDYLSSRLNNTIQNVLGLSDRKAIFESFSQLQRNYHELFMGKQDILGKEDWDKFLKKLGLAPADFQYEDLAGNHYQAANPFAIQVYKVRPVYRTGREGQIIEQVVVTLLQKAELSAGPEKKTIFRGGCSIIINLADNFRIEYVITKGLTSKRRLDAHLRYVNGDDPAVAAALSESIYDDDSHAQRINFAKLHFHTSI